MASKYQDLIKEAKQDQPVQNPPESPISGLSTDLQDKLKASREKMRHATKVYVCGGILEALQEIDAGNFTDILPELSGAVEIFATRIQTPKLPNSVAPSQSQLFALPETARNG